MTDILHQETSEPRELRPHIVRDEPTVPAAVRRRNGTDDEVVIDLVERHGDHVVKDLPTVSVIIPAMNEAGNIEPVFRRLPPWIDELIVVDGGSTDGTVEEVLRVRPDARIVHQTGKGKGNALVCGFAAATMDVIVMLDADGSTDPAEIPRYVASLKTGADFAKGTRFVTGGGSSDITRIRRLGNKALCALVNTLFRTNFSDLCYGYNAFWRHDLDRLGINATGFEVETMMNIRAARRGLRIIEVPSYEAERLSGVSNLDAVRDGLRVLRTIFSERISVS